MAYYGLLMVFVLEYVRPGTYYPVINSIKLGTFLPLGLFALSLFLKSKNDHGDIWASSITKWLAYFVIIVLFSRMVMGGPDAAARFEMVLGYFFLYYMIVRFVDSKSKLKGIIFILALSHLYLLYQNPEVVTRPDTRTYILGHTFLGDGNDFALSLSLLLPLTFYLVLDEKSKNKKILYMAASIICVLALVGTQSRGASLGLGAVLAYLWWQSKSKVLGFIALFFLLAAVLLFAAPQYFARMGTLSNISEEGSAQGRIEAWKAGFRMFKHNPIMGVGVGNFGYANNDKTAHSIYFLALGELAIPGVIFLIAFFVGNFRRVKGIIKKIDPHDKENYRLFTYVYGCLLGFAVSAAFLSVLYYPHVFVISGIIFASSAIYQRELAEKEQDGAEVKV